MTDVNEPAAFAGVDWAMEKHDVCVLNAAGRVLGERNFPADADGLAAMATWIAQTAGCEPASVAVAIEVPHGPVVESLLERGFSMRSINPKQLDRFRDRFSVAGAKDDRRDARVLADSLRTDRRAYRAVQIEDPDVIELREWSRMEGDLGREDTLLCNRFRQQLQRFFPQVLELTDDVGEGFILDLLEVVPEPAEAHRRRAQTIENLLRRHRIRRLTADQVLEVLRRPALVVADGTISAATAHLRQLTARIRLVRLQRKDCRKALDTICARLSAPRDAEPGSEEGRKNEPSDCEILLSMPGVGRTLAPALLAEASRPLRERDYQALRTLCGIAPVTRRSGKSLVVGMRKACNGRLRNATYHWARVAAQCDERWKARYAAFRSRGHSHPRACRGVADSLLRVVIAMLKSRTLYDPARVPVAHVPPKAA